MAATSVSLQPAATPPPGVLTNFDDPPSHARTVYIVMSVCLGLVTLLVAVRIYTRARISKPLWWDDLASLLAWVFFIGLVRVTFGAVENGGGVDLWNVTKPQYREFNKFWKDIMIIARVDITFAKVAILLLYLRIFVPLQTGRRQMWFWIWFMIGFNVVYCVVLILLVQLQCIRRPNPPPNGSCLNQHALLISASTINVLTEIAILLVAILAVWGLTMPMIRKIAIVALLSFGTTGIGFSAARLIWQSVTHNNNPTVYNMTVIMLATAETTVAIMAGCLPLLSQFYKYHVESHVTHLSMSINASRLRGFSSEKKKRKKPHHPLSISETELVETDIGLESQNQNQNKTGTLTQENEQPLVKNQIARVAR